MNTKALLTCSSKTETLKTNFNAASADPNNTKKHPMINRLDILFSFELKLYYAINITYF